MLFYITNSHLQHMSPKSLMDFLHVALEPSLNQALAVTMSYYVRGSFEV